jgi:hypothetical protein
MNCEDVEKKEISVPFQPPLDNKNDVKSIDDNLSTELGTHSEVNDNSSEVSKSTLSEVLVCRGQE